MSPTSAGCHCPVACRLLGHGRTRFADGPGIGASLLVWLIMASVRWREPVGPLNLCRQKSNLTLICTRLGVETFVGRPKNGDVSTPL